LHLASPFRRIHPLLCVALALAMVVPRFVFAQESSRFTNAERYNALFEDAGTQGTMLILRTSDGKTAVVNEARAAIGHVPASTFKILNSLIAIEAGLVKDVDAVAFPYSGNPFFVDGKPFLPAQCNADLSLRTAFRFSCIPVYQSLARQVGPDRYRAVIGQLGYGNGAIDKALSDAFWLKGEYKVTPLEQVELLLKLFRNELPFRQKTMDQIKDIMLIERTGDFVLRGKTGYLYSTRPALGWFVGWLETPRNTYVFALNLDITKLEHSGLRLMIAKQVLEGLGAW
jgi:beta-lactamase class D